ncbi:MAG: hypothetical protein JO114_15275 [Planctomycetaceae bacterium]|nr:hypothetical protein [Planctomycetaceae bacterium]
MKLVALEIPDDPALLPGWLEGHLVNTDLAALVAELEAVHGEHPDNLSLTDILRDRRDAVLSRGLDSLPAEGLKSLLRNPRLLLELQELILTEGGPCWLSGAAEAASKQDDLGRVWNRLSDPLQQTSRAAASPSRRVVPLARWIASFAAAAAIVLGVGVFLVERQRGGDQGATAVAASGWGWSRPGVLADDLPPGVYLDRLADAAGEWFKKRPDDPIALARRISEFRQGCSVLILSPHKPLSAQDRAWLVEKCRAWAAKLDAHLAALEAGASAAKVRDDADATVNKLIEALRDRAKVLA